MDPSTRTLISNAKTNANRRSIVTVNSQRCEGDHETPTLHVSRPAY
jgi:hypothetical protein